MPASLSLTGGVIRVTANTVSDLRNALDVSEFRSLDLLLDAIVLEGTSSPTAVVEILTGMQRETDQGWITVFAFNTVNASQGKELKQALSFLRYIRWKVTLMGTNSVLTFSVGGMGKGD